MATETERSQRGAAALKKFKGRTLGGYTIVDHLDTGGMAEIFLARHERAGGFRKELVLKLLQERFVEHKQVVRMFHDEARIGARLDHPSIVDVFNVGEEDGQHFIAMEHIEGRTLTQLIRRGLEVSRPLPLPHAAFICAQVAEGLSYMSEGTDRQGHRLNVVHRDITPTNIIISDRGHTKIIDFGIATDREGDAAAGKRDDTGVEDEPRDESGDDDGAKEPRPGKYSYMSPEQVKGGKLDGRSDIFSLGIMLYEITLGRRLYRGAPQVVMKRIVEDRIRPPTFIDREYPPVLELIVMRALEKRPEDRYQSADELCRDLDAFLGEHIERIGDRQIADHVRAIESPQAVVTDAGARRAAAFMLEDDADDEPLDFHRGNALGFRTTGPQPETVPARPTRPRTGEIAVLAGGKAGASGAAPGAAAVPAAAAAAAASVGFPYGTVFFVALAAAAIGAAAAWHLGH